MIGGWLTLSILLSAQEIRIGPRKVELHGFGTQGFLYTNTNNWLTTNSNQGSFAFTDMGLNAGMQLRSNLRIGGQVYDRNLGQLGQWHPQLDWALIDWRPKGWLGFRAGKVKTILGLYNDTQDQDFAITWALLPQSVYPIDLRDATIAHEGGDIYGEVRLPHRRGTLNYTAYGGRRSDSLHSGFAYLATRFQIDYSTIAGPIYGGDLRWQAPLHGLTLGISRLDQALSITGWGAPPPPTPSPYYKNEGPPGFMPFWQYSRHDWINQYFGQYIHGRLHLDAEYRRNYQDWVNSNGIDNEDIRGWYAGGGLRVNRWFELGSYYSHYRDIPQQSQVVWPYPQTRDFDKVVSGKFTLNRFTTFKVEGHFMNGYGDVHYPNGFYPEQNPDGFATYTNALVVRAGFSF
jgi:hypothetical protein